LGLEKKMMNETMKKKGNSACSVKENKEEEVLTRIHKPLTCPMPDPTRFFIIDWAWAAFVCSFALTELS
jgi:hypothetical protein